MNTSLSTRRLPTSGGQNPVNWVTAAFSAWRQRHALEQLDDHMLDDIGLTRRQVVTETNKPIWDIPAHWRG